MDPECVQLFVEEVRLDPKSETAKDYYKAVKDAWVITQKSAALAAKRKAAEAISALKKRIRDEYEDQINDPKVCLIALSPLLLSQCLLLSPKFS